VLFAGRWGGAFGGMGKPGQDGHFRLHEPPHFGYHVPMLKRCRWKPAVFILLVAALTSAGSIAFCEDPSDKKPDYPLWDGKESIADYGKRTGLETTQTLDLGGGVKLELVLIPAGKFVMGTPEPTPVDEDGFQKKIILGQVLLAVSATALLVMLLVVVIKAIRKKRRPQISLVWLLLVTVAAGGAVLSGVHWRQTAKALQAAQIEYAAARARFQSANDTEKPAHDVMLTKPFYMGKYDITQEQYQQLIGTNPSQFKGKDNPVENVSWDDAQVFCKRLSEQTKQAVRLPTEAEWEFGCRAGTTTSFYSGDTDKDLARVAWYNANSKNMTHPVGQKEPNAFGLYDMHGNVWQWCQDFYGEDYYRMSEAENPLGPIHGAFRLLRGGDGQDDPMFCRSASRSGVTPDGRDDFIGFRVAAAPAFRTPP